MSISLRNIRKSFGSFVALDNVSLDIPDGQLVALLGPSGSGKTTLLRIIAGLEQPDPGSGSILFCEEDVRGRPVGDRKVGFVFQHYALFRHMSVFENVAFGLRVQPRKIRPSRQEIRERVHKLLELVQLDWLAERYPSQLSGGQRQRIALARALAVEPKVLLLDEPFGALDAKVRVELRRWLRRLHDEIHITSVFVTHDQEEALEVADQVVVMDHGRIEQVGTPEEVYNHPANAFVYQFLGSVNQFHARVEDGRAFLGKAEMAVPELGGDETDAVGYVRPHEIDISRTAEHPSAIRARVRFANAAGPFVRVELEREGSGGAVEVVLSRERFSALGIRAGEQVYLIPRQFRVFADSGNGVRPPSPPGA